MQPVTLFCLGFHRREIPDGVFVILELPVAQSAPQKAPVLDVVLIEVEKRPGKPLDRFFQQFPPNGFVAGKDEAGVVAVPSKPVA